MPTPTIKRVKDWFHLKNQFTSFHLEPEKHAKYFFGQEDQKLRDQLITSLEETAFSERGYRAIVFGRAGRGKTHLAHHLRFEAVRRDLPVELVYVHCPTLLTKAPVKDLFATITQGIPWEIAKRFVRRYWEIKTEEAEARVKAELKNDMIYEVLMQGLESASPRTVENTLKWLGGQVVDMNSVIANTPEQITDGSQLARNLGALAEILLFAEGKNLILMVDEAERLREIRRGDPYNLWLEALREIFRRPTLGLLMFVIAEGRDDIPELLYEEEVMSSIGSNNVWESAGFGGDSAGSFLRDLLTHVIQREPCPPCLTTLLGESNESLETYPLTADAFDEFVAYHSRPPANRPREMLNNLEAAARRAISRNKRFIDMPVLQEILEGV